MSPISSKKACRPALFEFADATMCAPVKAPCSWPNKFAFQQGVSGMAAQLIARNGFRERLLWWVNRPGDEFLARPAFARDEDGDIRLALPVRWPCRPRAWRTVAQQQIAVRHYPWLPLRSFAVLHGPAGWLTGGRQQYPERFRAKRLEDVLVRTLSDIASIAISVGASSRKKDDRHTCIEVVNLPKNVQSGIVRQSHVEQNDIRLVVLNSSMPWAAE